ncbi:FxsA family protein [Sulfurimonas sp. HSL-3221]|uniref:FxsA family protein n=1 Tax=Sulfurimonadaceae TaxID=2771471 RepID=UPI001E432C26|nr:FxsA family protein [Sulfurimonas sp. HSL-3221]UFS63446.1 FxsA family protein [Sulfurimonas sp. HSL-3221]
MIYFLLYLFLEVLVSVKIASAIGGVWTFVELIASALVGIVILANFRGTLAENINALNQARIDPFEFQQLNLFTILGAFLLIAPGFLTDIFGVLLQFSVITKMLVNRFVSQSKHDSSTHNTQKDDHVIDVEIVSDDADKR